MADHRTRRQKLEAMANQTASPYEASIAREMLAKMGNTTIHASGSQTRTNARTSWTAEGRVTDDDATFDTETYWDWQTGTYRMRMRPRYREYVSESGFLHMMQEMQRRAEAYEEELRRESERRKQPGAEPLPHWWQAWEEMHNPAAAEAAQRRRWEEKNRQSEEAFQRYWRNEQMRGDPGKAKTSDPDGR